VIKTIEEAFSIMAAFCPEAVASATGQLDSLRCGMEDVRCAIAELLGHPLKRRPTLIQSGPATMTSPTAFDDALLALKRLDELLQILMHIERDLRAGAGSV
jgi:hypothetical protein